MISDKSTYTLTYARTLFVATFFLIAFNVPPNWLFGINADWFKIINMMIFSVTNGYCSCLLAIKAPNKAQDD
jgi:hypothetical protein